MTVSSVKDPIAWDELRLFLAVARAQGLSGAARQTGVSAPTLGRRMTTLERRLNQRLFVRKQTGYDLSEAGRDLYRQAQEMEAVAGGIERWREDYAPRRLVRISAGAWTSRFLARHMDRLWQDDDSLAIELSTRHQRVDIGRRQADIGVRNRAPEEPRLAGRRMNDVAFAVYRASGAPDDLPWIGVIGESAITPAAQWVNQRHMGKMVLTCSDPRVVVDLLLAGVGQALLPCFVGDDEPALERVETSAETLREQQWLVLNDEGRRDPSVRRVIDRLAALLEAHRPLFEGARGRPKAGG